MTRGLQCPVYFAKKLATFYDENALSQRESLRFWLGYIPNSCLIKISEIVATNDQLYDYAVSSVQIAKESIGRLSAQGSAAEQFNAINESVYNWLKSKHDEHKIKDFGYVFEKYINQ
ncbi:YvbH-like oligomerization domain-containing protein [Paenibacillus ginsengihumi]|uniref:YvbH-like oligomerization domain-containing protein n=1 Tax=Paenibacillus ginsengihumi TaxID=431596 RepID=UPI000A033DF1|nr:YvbH-like oligomerization domain-containing protein [Paenibacillus ginsengihumi]